MGKILKGTILLAASAVGTYYYKNPKELEKHKEVLKENIKVGLEKIHDLANIAGEQVDYEQSDIAREKLEEVTANYNVVQEETFIPLREEAEEELEEIIEEAEETREELEENIEELNEKLEDKAEEISDKAEAELEVKDVEVLEAQKELEAARFEEEQAQKELEEAQREVLEAQKELEAAEIEVEEAKKELEAARIEVKEAEDELEEAELAEEVKPKTTLDSIVALFSTKEENK